MRCCRFTIHWRQRIQEAPEGSAAADTSVKVSGGQGASAAWSVSDLALLLYTAGVDWLPEYSSSPLKDSGGAIPHIFAKFPWHAESSRILRTVVEAMNLPRSDAIPTLADFSNYQPD